MATEEVKKIFEEKCRKKDCIRLKKFADMDLDLRLKENVARWCPICGTVVVDIDVTTVQAPEQIMKARHPKILERSLKKPARGKKWRGKSGIPIPRI